MLESTGSCPFQYLSEFQLRARGIAGGPFSVDWVIVEDVLDFAYTSRDSEPMEWQATFDNSSGKYSRFLSPGDPRYTPISPLLEPVKYVEWTFRAKVETDIASPTDEIEYYKLTALTYNSGVDANGGYVVTISGTDNSWLLYQDNQTMPTWRTTVGGTILAFDIINGPPVDLGGGIIQQGICTKFGVDVEHFWQNYPVRWCHMQGEIPMDIIKQIIGVRWAKWRIRPSDGKLIIYNSPESGLEGLDPDWDIIDRKTIENLSYSINRWNVCTEVIVRRLAETSGICFEEERGGTSIDLVEHKIDFDTGAFPYGASNVNIWTNCVGGSFTEMTGQTSIWLYAEPGGGGAAVRYGGPGAIGPFKSVGFFFRPTTPPAPGVELYYRIVGRGVQHNPLAGFGAPTADFFVRWRNNNIKTWIGENRPAKDPVINSLIPDNATCDSYAQSFLRESASNFEVISGTIGFHPSMLAGHVLNVCEYGSNFKNRKFYVTEASHSFSNGTTTITAKRYRTEDEGSLVSVPRTDP
jgi:hypothetical protein